MKNERLEVPVWVLQSCPAAESHGYKLWFNGEVYRCLPEAELPSGVGGYYKRATALRAKGIIDV